MCFATGQLVGAGVLQSFIGRSDQWAWRIPFAIQWLCVPFLIVAAVLMPESPRWLVRKGKYAKAEKSVVRLMAKSRREYARPLVALMIHTNNIEREMSEGTSYLDYFRSIDLYFFEKAGVSSDNAYKLNLAGTAIAFYGTNVSWYLMCRLGRRTLYIGGLWAMALWLFIIGCLSLDTKNPSVKWGQSADCIIWLLSFSLTVGPIGWTIPAEVSSTRLRSKTVVLAQIVANVIEPHMMNPTAWSWKGKTEFFWFA